jgi:hypothetical protein
MPLRVGKIFRGTRGGTYELLGALKAPTVYKARVLSGPHINKRWYVSTRVLETPITYFDYRAVVKTAASRLENVSLNREHNIYHMPDIASSPYIPALYDTVGSFEVEELSRFGVPAKDPSCLVFEWMETDLHSLSSYQYRRNSRLPKIISKSVLSALDMFRRYNGTYTGKHSVSSSVTGND